MGFFKEIEIDVIDMFHSEGMKETEIATSMGIPLEQVHEILAAYDNHDMDYNESDIDADESYQEVDSDDDYNAEHY